MKSVHTLCGTTPFTVLPLLTLLCLPFYYQMAHHLTVLNVLKIFLYSEYKKLKYV